MWSFVYSEIHSAFNFTFGFWRIKITDDLMKLKIVVYSPTWPDVEMSRDPIGS